MAVTLVVNPGSSSKKYALYRDGQVAVTMRFERSEGGFELCTEHNGVRQKCEGVSADTFKDALAYFLNAAQKELIIKDRGEITMAAVRVVAPGKLFQKHARIDEIYLHKLRLAETSAPLHVPHTLREIESLRRLVPKAVLIAASDSAFHATIPAHIRQYSIPETDTVTLDLYRFGYHGLSTASVVGRVHAVVGTESERLVVCHLGSGLSVTAVLRGKSLDTTMGYSPGSGLMMASRSGDLDVGALLALMRAKNLRPLDAEVYLSTKGGLYGVAGEADLRLIIERAACNEVTATRALSMYVHHLQQKIAGAITVLGGVDLIIFTATAGERSPLLRERICNGFSFLGVKIDVDKNTLLTSKDGVISAYKSPVKVAVIRTDEMGEMFRVASKFS